MPEIETRRADLRELRGLHLWHAAFSNCSQRVRLVLEEKGLSWTSHLVDLSRFEHATPKYQSIHPDGLVPALIHDGRTIIESNHIISYVDTRFPGISLSLPDDGEVDHLLSVAARSQLALRTLSHEFLIGDRRRYDIATLEKFERSHRNREFAAFLRQFATEGFSDERLLQCFGELDAALELLDARLADRDWLAGATLTLADFSWLPNVHRLSLFEFPLARHRNLMRWFENMRARPSYTAALSSYETHIQEPTEGRRRRRVAFFEAALAG